MVVLAGPSHIARVGVALNRRYGLEDWIAGSVDEYRGLAVAHISRAGGRRGWENRKVISDTDELSQAVWIELQRRRTPGQQITRALEMTQLVRSLFAANLRREYPEITEQEIKRRMVEAYYGAEWAERMFGKRAAG